MRGKVPNRRSTETKPGITPAYAGKSTCLILFDTLLKDHPRVCGEKRCYTALCRPGVGSPPRVRGKAALWRVSRPLFRITPACAGKSAKAERTSRCSWDHPRVCGEKDLVSRQLHFSTGSPPRVRGKVRPYEKQRNRHGITPACAGKRLKRSHSIGHFSCILCLFHSVLHRASVSGGSRAGPCAPPCLPAQNAVPV